MSSNITVYQSPIDTWVLSEGEILRKLMDTSQPKPTVTEEQILARIEILKAEMPDKKLLERAKEAEERKAFEARLKSDPKFRMQYLQEQLQKAISNKLDGCQVIKIKPL